MRVFRPLLPDDRRVLRSDRTIEQDAGSGTAPTQMDPRPPPLEQNMEHQRNLVKTISFIGGGRIDAGFRLRPQAEEARASHFTTDDACINSTTHTFTVIEAPLGRADHDRRPQARRDPRRRRSWAIPVSWRARVQDGHEEVPLIAPASQSCAAGVNAARGLREVLSSPANRRLGGIPSPRLRGT